MKIINYIRWYFIRRELEQNLRTYVELEYKNDDKYSAFQRIYAEHKSALLGV